MNEARVLDKYGNNQAVQCRSCTGVFVISKYLNRKSGRICPHCGLDKVIFSATGDLEYASGSPAINEPAQARAILALVKPLAAKFYQVTHKPLGATGEVAEFAVIDKFPDIELAVARTEGFDAKRGEEKIQIKGRALGAGNISHHRISRIKQGANCHAVMLVILDQETLDAREIWEAPYSEVELLLKKEGSEARKRGSLSIGEFKKTAKQIWP